MTREQAINHIKNSTLYKYDRETADMAITALEAEPCSDAISRQAAKEAIRKAFPGLPGLADRVEINSVLNDLPNVTPKQRTGGIG